MASDNSYEDIVTSLQISLRKEAGLSYYNPSETSLPILPSPEEAIPQLDPSPPYLRCKHCKGRLLRGIASIICVFCGRQPYHKDVPPDPIKFVSTVGSRWFLRSLDLDGSELVEPDESNKGQTLPANEIPLSEFLDLDIRWPSEPEKSETSVWGKTADQKLSSLNLEGVDIDDFFAEGKANFVSASAGGQVTVNEQNNASASGDPAESHADLSLFENVQHSEMVARLEEDDSGDPSSSWDAEFQSADLGTRHQESESVDPFVASSTIDLSAHMDSVFASGKDSFDEKQAGNAISPSSNTNDWFNVDTWGNPSSEETRQSEQVGGHIDGKNDRASGDANTSSSMNVDWLQRDQRQTANDSKTTDSKAIDEDDDSFGDWNDFTGSSSAQVPTNGSLTKVTDHTVPSIEQSSEINLFDGSTTLQDVDFGTSQVPFNGLTQITMQAAPSGAQPSEMNLFGGPITSQDVDFGTWQVPFNGSLTQATNQAAPSVEQPSEINLFGGPSSSQDVDFGSFVQPDLFSGTFTSQNGSTDFNILQPETSFSDRNADVNALEGKSAEEVKSDQDGLDGKMRSKGDDDVENLMSQMHDLSFMLESNLTVPQTKDRFGPYSNV
ncbi:hypothetical protein Tsubulata_040956 [Turnera subulata]|uniref:DUF7815 domain-containing protein n=1 Tax=Turnera subulata TaxID=218843 RepID=A0A9Q0GF97_9ROSI|nr:hypothetical protein Tsubulata_040956 [Turnera subulata]